MSKHTAGPWKVGSWYDGRLAILVADIADYSIVAELTGAKREHEANAALIAAAPEMLEALQHISARFALMAKALPEEQRADAAESLTMALAAIAKAKGE